MYSENPADFPNIWFILTRLVARQSQQTIHEPLNETPKNHYN